MAKDRETPLRRLPVGSVKPDGWLAKQLGIVNALQKRMGADPSLLEGVNWKGGEIFPRYVRGLILLAGVLGEPQLTVKAEGYMNAVFDAALEGGDLLPEDRDGEAPKTEAVKTLLSFYELTGEQRALTALKKFFKSRFNTMSVTHSWHHARARLHIGGRHGAVHLFAGFILFLHAEQLYECAARPRAFLAGNDRDLVRRIKRTARAACKQYSERQHAR